MTVSVVAGGFHRRHPENVKIEIKSLTCLRVGKCPPGLAVCLSFVLGSWVCCIVAGGSHRRCENVETEGLTIEQAVEIVFGVGKYLCWLS